MQIFLEILKFTIPSLLVLLGMYMLIDKLFKQESARREFELYKINKDTILPVKLRAYERLTLFLQRTTPESMLMRYDFAGFTVLQLQQLLLQTVRDEFDHNISQQIYVSKDLWVMVGNARESIVQLINSLAVTFPADAPAIDYAKAILSTYASSQNSPTEIALDYIKSEVKQF